MVRKRKDTEDEEMGGIDGPERSKWKVRFKGGKQSQRDKRYGVTDDEFWKYWHRKAKKGYGRDGTKCEILKEYENWKANRNREPHGE